MLKYKSLNHSPHFLSQNGGSLWLTLVKSITLWVLMTSVSCQCGNPDGGLFSFKKEDTLSLKVDNSTLRGDEQTFCLTIENTSKNPVDLRNYRLIAHTQESNSSRSSISYRTKRDYPNNLQLGEFGTSLIQITDEFKLILNPAETYSLPSFTLNPARDVRDLTIHFELMGHFDKNPTATATVNWQDVPYHLKFQDLQNWVGKVESSFRIHNTSETVYAKNITVEIESNNQVELKIGNQTGRNLAVNLASLLGSNLSRLEQQAITPPINLQVYDAHDKQSAKITLRLLDKNMQEVDRQSVMWYSTSISLEGPDFFSKDSIDLSIKVQAAKLVETNQVRVYLRNSNGVAFTLNDQQVGSNGIGLADILQGDNNLDIGKTINLAIDSNPNHAPNTDITLELRNEKNQVLVYKKISWWDTNLIKATMQDLKENNTSLGLILRLLNQGNTLQKVIDRIGPEKGQTILHEAIEYGKKYKKELFYILLSAGADVNAKNKEDDTPLHIAVKGDQVEIVKTLLNAKASTTATNKDGDKPLHIAAKNGNQKIVNLLLQKETSASVADKGYIYRTPLHWAAIGNNQEVIKALIQKGDTHLIDQQDQDGRTALHLAASKDYVKMVDILLTNGADKNIKDKHGKRPTDYTKDPIIKAKLR